MPPISSSVFRPAAPKPHEESSVGGAWRLPACLLGALVGAAVQLQQPQLWPGPVYGVLLALAGVAWLVSSLRRAWWGHTPLAAERRWRSARAMGFAACAGALALFAVCGLRAGAYASHALAPGLEGRDLRVTGVVAAMPQVNEMGVRLRLEVEAAFWQGAAVTLPPLVDVSWYGDAALEMAQPADALRQPPSLRAGERWEMTVRLKAPHGARNPHGFDYELWMWEQGVQATGYVRTGSNDLPPVRLGSTWRHPVERARQAVRDAIVSRLAGSAAAGDAGQVRVAGVVAALVTGDQRAIDRADWDVFRATGVAHLMSISGLHITLFAWLAALVVRRLWCRSPRLCLAVPAPSAALVAGVLLAGAYALFSGWGVPAQRTVLMLATIAALQLSGRRWPWPQVWLLACAVVV
nr:ComEC/Rec2 family competence protein [Acidovorax sp.]